MPQANQQTGKPANESNLLMLPGLIDCHVHFREPGNTDAEDMESGAETAWSGGVTTVCDMPNTNPPTCTVKALEDKIQRVEKMKNEKLTMKNFDMRFFLGVTKREHLFELEKAMQNDALKRYVPGVKLYFGHSTGNQKAEGEVVEETFKFCAKQGIVVVCHCEDEEVIRSNKLKMENGELRMHSEIRSVRAAVVATEHAIALARKYGTHLHIAHVSTGDEIALIRKAKMEGFPITCEVAPHHLFLTIEDYKTLGTLVKMNPPLRTTEHVTALWEGIGDKTVDCIASDHAPHTLEEKLGRHAEPVEALEAPSGVPGVETMLPLLLSCIFGKGPIDANGKSRLLTTHYSLQPSDLLRLLFTRPNEIFSLGKPGVPIGKPAEMALVNPKETWVIRGKELHSKCGWTPYEGWTIQGRIERIIG